MEIKRSIIEQVSITGNRNEIREAVEWCTERGFHITQTGMPEISKNYFDLRRYVITAHRPVEIVVPEVKE